LAQTALPGHWEGDLVFGSGNSQIATLVERQTRYVMLIKLDGKDTQTVVNALIKHARKLPQELYKSLTRDRGAEMHAHKQFTLATDIQVYFCDPQSPWQRGSNMGRFSGEWPHICRAKINKGGLKPALVR
jgi:IS30 family transposase